MTPPRPWESLRGRSASPTRTFRRPAAGTVLLALVAYVPLLLTKPGSVGADTKTYLYLDPGRLLSRAAWMWDPNIGMGTVTHQNIGYLWPMGPYYWLMEAMSVPDWVAQRLWLGSIILAAGLGVRFMMRELRWVGAGVTVASFAYALSPYLLHYAARISVILLPFAGLPWLVGLAARALRRDDWRTPAWFALVTLTVGGVNATSLLLVMVGPLMWFVHAVLVQREVTLRRALVVGLKISALTLATSLWWIAGLMIQGAYGIPILRYTETYATVAAAALSTEVFRGLGYWFFYGRDGLGAWTSSTVSLLESLPHMALSFALPLAATASGLLTRFRHRIFFALIVVAGLVIAVGAHPWDSPSPYGALFKAWSRSDLGLSFRSTPRAVPLVALGLAVFLGAGVAALARRRPRWQVPVAGLLLVLVCVNSVALFRGQMVDRNLLRDEELPEYWLEAAEALDRGDPRTRVLELPGIDFAAYRWGNTVDPITPGLMDRDYVARELIPYGSPQSANLLNAVDQRLQDGRIVPEAIAPLARLMGVGEIVHRADLQFERYRTPRPRQTAERLDLARGLGEPRSFGAVRRNEASELLPLDDEAALAGAGLDDPAPVSIYPVEDAQPMLRTLRADAPTIVAGDGDGIVSLASIGALWSDRPFLYSASFADEPDRLRELASEPAAQLVVTDTNRRQARRWGSVRENDGYTERVGEEAVEVDPSDNRLEVFPDATDDHRSVAQVQGPVTVSGSAYGNGITYTAGDRASNALDGDPVTAWRVAAFDDVQDEYLRVESEEPITTDRIGLLLTQESKSRWITGVDLVFDGGDPLPVVVEGAALFPPGQEITFPERTFRTLDIVITATNIGELKTYRGVSDVGIAELSIPGVEPVVETVRPPVDLLEAIGASSIDRALTYLFNRRAASIDEALGHPEEPTMRRWIDGPVARWFTPYGQGRLSDSLPDHAIDRALGMPGADAGGVDARSSARMARDPRSRASAAVDGDPDTAYRTLMNDPVDSWIEFTYPEPIELDQLELELVTDGLHSVPTTLSLSIDGAEPRSLSVDEIPTGEGRAERSTTAVTLDTGPLRGRSFRFTIDAVQDVVTEDWFGGGPVVLPVGIAEIGLPQVAAPADSEPLADDCRSDLVEVDGEPVGLRVIGTVGEALDSRPLQLEACGDPVRLEEGRRLLTTAKGQSVGIEVDLLALSSAAGGEAGTDTLATGPADPLSGPSARTERTGRNSHSVTVDDASAPYWVVLGQSHSAGFTARTSSGEDLGEPTLVNGYANGWRIDPAELGADVTIEIGWAPQRLVWIGLALSAVGVLVCIGLIVWPRRRGGGDPHAEVVVRHVSPLEAEGAALPLRRTLAVSLAIAAVAAFLAGAPVGLAVGVAAGVALGTPRGQTVLRAVAIGALVASVGFMLLKQYRNSYEVDFIWPQWFETTHAWTLVAVLLLGLDPVVERLRTRRRANGPEDGQVE
jgi:arabinofuranan 3-O-arabinosyltransferase